VVDHWEVRHWCNGVRMIAVFREEKHAVAYSDRLPRNQFTGIPRIVQVSSSRSMIKQFWEIRKAWKKEAAELARVAAMQQAEMNHMGKAKEADRG
jgi:hypothetical protein